MIRLLSTSLSRLSALSVMLCMVAVLVAGFSAVQSNVLNIEHMASGDAVAADGGWVKACDGGLDDCDGHMVPLHSHDGGPIHHHHNSGETQFGATAAEIALVSAPYATTLDFRPGEATRLDGLDGATPDQPPRA